MSGWDKAPEYGGPPCTWQTVVPPLVLIGIVIALAAWWIL
jgi:hypothetical protein